MGGSGVAKNARIRRWNDGMSDQHPDEDELGQLARRTGPWLLVALLLLGLGMGAFVWALTPANSALRTPPESRR
jgi:hypothetical protein